MSYELDRLQANRNQESPSHRNKFQETSGEVKAQAPGEAFLSGPDNLTCPDLAPTLASVDSATRTRMVHRLQQERGNAFVGRMVVTVQRQPRPPEADVAPVEVPGLTPDAARQANEHIAARKRQEAIDVIVDDLVNSGQIDRALLHRGQVRYSTAVTGEGESMPPGYRGSQAAGTRQARPTRVRIGRRAFGSGLPWLVSTILHEYQHVLQFQVAGASVVPGQANSEGLIRKQDVEAYATEILQARQTGLAGNARQMRETWARLHDMWSRLGQPGKRQLNDLYQRAHTEAEAILGTPVRQFTPLR